MFPTLYIAWYSWIAGICWGMFFSVLMWQFQVYRIFTGDQRPE